MANSILQIPGCISTMVACFPFRQLNWPQPGCGVRDAAIPKLLAERAWFNQLTCGASVWRSMASFQSKQTPLHLDRLSRSKWDEVLQLRLKDSLIELDVVAMNSMARTVGRKAWWMASMLVEQLQIPMNVVTYNSLISSADWPWSLALFEQMQQTRWSPNVISFNAALKVMDSWIKALHLFHAAQGLQPDLVTCSTLGSRLGPWYFAASAVTQMMMMRGFRLNTLTYNAFANSIQPGDWKSSNLLLAQTAMQRDLVSYSIMMDGHQEISDWPFAFHFLQKTQQLAIRPDPALFHIALKNLEDSKRWTSSLSILSAQKSLGQVATGVSYALTLGSFGSSPRWAMALQLMEGAETLWNGRHRCSSVEGWRWSRCFNLHSRPTRSCQPFERSGLWHQICSRACFYVGCRPCPVLTRRTSCLDRGGERWRLERTAG